jgi:hypothetical protein
MVTTAISGTEGIQSLAICSEVDGDHFLEL